MRSYLAVLLLAGCTIPIDIDYSTPPPADWPKLTERITRVPRAQIPKFCAGLGRDAYRSASCAITRFRLGICDIFLSTDKPSMLELTDEPSMLEHERAHCRGYGHVGDASAPADAWNLYKASRR